MGESTTIEARDGHKLHAYRAQPAGKPRGAIIVVQEIFGVNRHIRAVTDGFAAEGYVAIAPSMFDRVRRDVELSYTELDALEGLSCVSQLKLQQILLDLSAAIEAVRDAGNVGIVGYCWGGRVTYIAACDLPIAGAVSYYGRGIKHHLDKKPKCPLMFHFAKRDKHIPLNEVGEIRRANPEGIVHMYSADHAFNCDERASYDARSAALARNRTLEFLGEHIAVRRVASAS